MRIFLLHKIIILLTLIIIVSLSLSTQTDSSRIDYGIWSSINFNNHIADFKKLPNCPSCSPGYRDGTGTGVGIGLVLDYPLDPSWMLSGKLFYKSIGAKLLRTEFTNIIVSTNINGSPIFTSVDSEIEHTLDATLGIIAFEPSVKYNIWNKFYLNIGLQFAYFIQQDYTQVEKLIKPNVGTFILEDGTDTYSRERNKFSGSLESANSLYLAPSLSLSYKLPINSTNEWFLEPELGYSLGMTNIVSDVLVNKWKANSLGVGLSFKYSPKEQEPLKEEYKRIEKIDTVRQIVENIEKDEFIIGMSKSDVNISQYEKLLLTQETITRTDTIRIAKIVVVQKFETIAKIDTLTIISEDVDRDILVKGISKADTNIITSKNLILTRETVTRTDTLRIGKIYKLEGHIAVWGVDRQDVEFNTKLFQVEEYSSNRLAPLLNYIFFGAVP